MGTSSYRFGSLARYLVIGLVVLLVLLLVSYRKQASEAASRQLPAADTRIPLDTPDYGTDVETWWETHPFNRAISNYIPIGGIASPAPQIDVQKTYQGNIQAAIDALPPSGGTLYFAPGTYSNTFKLVAKSNVHFVSSGGAILSGGQGWIVGCQEALDYSTIAAEVHSHLPAGIACVTTDRIHNIYFKNIVFDGNGAAHSALYLSAANGIVFDNVVFQNFHDSTESTTALVNGNVDLQNIWFRGTHFAGRARWALYLDGAHFSGVVQSTIDYNFGDMDSSSGGLLFMTNDDLNGDYDQNGTFEPNEKRLANHIVIAYNTFGADGGESMHSAIAMNGSNVLVKGNTVLHYVYRFALFMGKCDAINPGVDMAFYNLKVIGNHTKATTIFTQVNGAKYDCDILHNTMDVGKYVVRDNNINGPGLSSLVWESSPPIQTPNVVENNCVNGTLYGEDIACDPIHPRSLHFLPMVVSRP